MTGWRTVVISAIAALIAAVADLSIFIVEALTGVMALAIGIVTRLLGRTGPWPSMLDLFKHNEWMMYWQEEVWSHLSWIWRVLLPVVLLDD
jgi:hypothetical protein